MGRAGTGRRRARVSVSAAVAVVTLGGAAARWAAAGTWAHDPATVGDWFTASNWQPAYVPFSGDSVVVNNGGTAQIAAGNVAVNGLDLGSTAAGSGTVSVTGGALIWTFGNAYVGDNGVGRLVQTGGRVNDPTVFSPSFYSPGPLYVGYNSGATGTYELGGTGRLGTPSSTSGGHDEYIGYAGRGSFVQTGGTHYLTYNSLNLGSYAGSAGLYSLSGGRLYGSQGASVYVGGYAGGGRFQQSGGTFTQFAGAPSLYVGYSTGFGRYELSGGTMSGVTESVGAFGGAGYFAQGGGTNEATSLSIGSRGRYVMTGGSLTAGSASVGGTMSQGGGTVSAGSLTVGVGGRYELSGGSLSATNLRNDGVLAFGAPGGAVSAGGLVNFAHGTLVNPQYANVTIQPGALVVVPAGFDPAATFGSFTNQGTLHVAGTTLSVGTGQGFTGAGTIDDFVDLNGGTMSGQIYYAGGVSARGAARVFNGGALTVEGSVTSGVADTAEVTFGAVTIAAQSGAGTFVQSGGQNNAGRLVVESGGRYVLSGGTLAVTSGLENRGVIDLAGGGGTVSVNGGIADFTQGSLVNTSQGTLAGTSSSSLVLLPAGSGAMFKSVTTPGLVHAAGTALAIPAGRTIFGPGTITDHVDVAGSLYGGVNLLGGVAVSGTGSVSAGRVLVGDATSGISGGSLSASDATVLPGGTFTQGAGSMSGTSLTVVGQYALGGGRLSPTYLRVRDGGTVVQSGGTNASFYSYVGDTAGGTGSYTLSAGSMSGADAYVGYNGGSGTFVQSGGTNSMTTYLGTGLAGAAGTYVLSGGGTHSGSMYAGDDGGTGTVVQTGGTQTGGVYLGYGAGSGGTYRLEAGQLSPNGTMYVGYRGSGAMVQTGGTMSNSGSTFYVGYQLGASGMYELQGGTLSAGGVTVGSSGAGTFVQSGGTSTLTGSLVPASASTAAGRYELSGGALTAPTQTIGINSAAVGETAAFVQTGGSNAANVLTVNLSGRYAMGGGTLAVAQGIVNSGVVDFGGGGAGPGVTLGGVTDFTQGTWLNLGQASVTGLAGSLIIMPAGFDVATGFKAFASSGLTHVAGTPLAIGAGEAYTWGGTIGDRVDVAGTVAGGVSGRPLQLTGGVTVSGAGSLTLATVHADGTGSGISGGQITSGTIYVGDAGTGVFEQTGGTCAPSTLIVGNLAGSAGTYVLSAGSLKGAQTIGAAGAGTLSQSGGTNTASTLVVGSQGVYRLSGGSLAVTSGMTLRGTLDLAGSAAAVTIGGIADWTGGGSVVDAGQASLTTNPGSLLIVPAGFDPANRFGTFAAGGMVHTLGTALNLPAGSGVTGSGTIADPVVVGGSVLGGSLSLTGGVTVGNGGRVVATTLTVNGPVAVGAGATFGATGTLTVGSGGTASMAMTGGVVSANTETVGNGAGDLGTVEQSGGTNSVVRTLNVGSGAGSQGRYVLSGGDVIVRPTSTFPTLTGGLIAVGSGGLGTFVQTGGRVIADAGTPTFTGFPTSAGLTLGALAGGSGTYEMEGGELTVDAEWLGAQALPFTPPLTSGGTGVLLQRGGVHTVRNTLAVRGASVVDVSGGTLDVGELDIAGNAATLAFELNGPADAMGFAVSARDAAVDGSLHVRLGAGFDPALVSGEDQFLLVDTYAVIGGAFDNVPSGSRLVTDDGRGSFVVNYGLGSPFGADRLVLSDFVAVPEPGIGGVLVAAGAAMGVGRRRRRA